MRPPTDAPTNEPPWNDAATYRGDAVKFEIAHSESRNETFWRIVAANGQTLATSEMYTRKASCVSAIASIQKNAANAQVVDLTAE